MAFTPKQPLSIKSIVASVKSDRPDIIIPFTLETYVEFGTSRGIVDVHNNGICRYFANEEDFDNLNMSDSIVANTEAEVASFVNINL